MENIAIYYLHTETLEQNLSRIKNSHSNLKTENRAVDGHCIYGIHKGFSVYLVASGKF